jgi:hypothetical protein
MIPKTVSIRNESNNNWLIRVRHSGFHEHNQAAIYAELDNPNKTGEITVTIKWAEFHAMETRCFLYLKVKDKYQVIRGEISSDRSRFVFKAPKGVSYIGWSPWYTNEDNEKFLEKAAKHKLCKINCIGKTKEGREIKCLVINNSSKAKRKNVLILAREHATETTGSFSVEAIVKFLLSKKCPPALLKKYNFHIVPVTNPDGVANGRKYPQEGPIELSDLHYAGQTSKDPTCKVMRDFTKSLSPACLITYHGFLSPVPEIITYHNSDLKNMADYFIRDAGKDLFLWRLKRQPGTSKDKSMLKYCSQKFGTVVAAFELPWAGNTLNEISKTGLKMFLAAMEAERQR